MTSLINVRAPTLDEWNSDAFTRLSLTSETLTWDLTMTHYSEQNAVMTDYSGNIVNCAAVRGRVGILAINLLSSLTTDLVDITALMNIFDCAMLRLLTHRPWPPGG